MRFNAAIFPAVTQDGIGTYIRGINAYLGLPVIPCGSHIISPRQFLGGVPAGFDLIHVPNFMVPMGAKGSKIVCTIQDIIPIVAAGNLNRLKEAYVHFRIRWSVKKSDHLIFTSESTRNDVERVFGKVQAYSVIPLAVDEPLPENRIPGAPYPFPYFFSVGRRRKHKNIEGILRAFAEAAQGTEARLVFGGKQDIQDEEWTRMARNLKVSDRIHFSGFLSTEQLAAHYRHATALVFPSLYEGFGLPILEAMSYGCPVITSDISSMPEVAGSAALLVDPRQYRSIAAAMAKLSNDTALREALIARGRTNLERFSWERSARLTEGVYSALLGNGTGNRDKEDRKVAIHG